MHERRAGHRTIVVLDVEKFGDPRRTNSHQLAVREGLYQAVGDAFRQAELPWTPDAHEDRGDGILILVPPEFAKSLFVEKLPSALLEALTKHNREHTDEAGIRLRMSLHAGEVPYDPRGVYGRAVIWAFRLVAGARTFRKWGGANCVCPTVPLIVLIVLAGGTGVWASIVRPDTAIPQPGPSSILLTFGLTHPASSPITVEMYIQDLSYVGSGTSTSVGLSITVTGRDLTFPGWKLLVKVPTGVHVIRALPEQPPTGRVSRDAAGYAVVSSTPGPIPAGDYMETLNMGWP